MKALGARVDEILEEYEADREQHLERVAVRHLATAMARVEAENERLREALDACRVFLDRMVGNLGPWGDIPGHAELTKARKALEARDQRSEDVGTDRA